MSADRSYDALLLDLDGTLLDSHDRIHPRSLEALRAARAGGVTVMLVTGRPWLATAEVHAQLELDTPAVVLNGSAVYCPKDGRMLEERLLGKRTVARLHAWRRAVGDLTVLTSTANRLCTRPRDAHEERSLAGLENLTFVDDERIEAEENVLRVTFLTRRTACSASYASEVETALDMPVYLTHFPLSVLPRHKQSEFHAVDVHPPCRGKAEALRVLFEQSAIPASRVVAIGDAANDEPLLRAAGLGVAMENAEAETRAVADRVIGHHDGPAIADLVAELFDV